MLSNPKSSTGQDNLDLQGSIFPWLVASQRQKVLIFLGNCPDVFQILFLKIHKNLLGILLLYRILKTKLAHVLKGAHFACK